MKKKKRSYARQIGALGLGVFGAAVGAHALGAAGAGMGGTAQTIATKGQAGLAGVTKFAPAAGTIIGVSIPLRIMHEAFPKKKVKGVFR